MNLDKENSNIEQPIRTENGDGYITFQEAMNTWRYGKGKIDLKADLNKLDLSKVKVSHFKGRDRLVVNFAGSKYYTNRTQALVYGNITLHLLPGNKVVASSDTYDFDLKMKKGTLKRDILTAMGHMVNGPGTPFKIHFRGSAIIAD